MRKWLIPAFVMSALTTLAWMRASAQTGEPGLAGSPAQAGSDTQTFADVPPGHPYYNEIERLYLNGFTAGCAVDPLRYCPDATMNRAESAVFVERGIRGTAGVPPQPTTQTFADLPLDSWAAKWAEALWQDHYTAGCGTNPLVYCPWQGHTRAEAAVFYLRMLHGGDYSPPSPGQTTFADVSPDVWYAPWVEAAYREALIPACEGFPSLRFCPEDPFIRSEAAHAMVMAKGLPVDGPDPSFVQPTAVPIESPEIVNPYRGLYRWRNSEVAPLPAPSLDAYDRITWRTLEPSMGVYDFSAIEAAAERAAIEGRKFAFRVRAVVSENGLSVPDYLVAMMPKGFWYDYDKDGTEDTYVPDWNDADFIDRAWQLFEALGTRFNGDPSIGWIDIGMYGNWGEWHMSRFPYPSPSGAERITIENKRELIDMHVRSFPDTRLVMMTDDAEGLLYALSLSPSIGWRRDSLAHPHFENVLNSPGVAQALQDRWKTAPVVTEMWSGSSDFLLGRQQVQDFHVSLVGNGNLGRAWTALSPAEQQAFIEMGKAAGYRFELDEVTVPSQVQPGGVLAIESTWQNVGAAPAYESWAILWELAVPSSRELAWQGISTLSLQSLLPAETSSITLDSYLLPTNLPAGEYVFGVRIVDTTGYRSPMALAIEGRATDGSYPLSMIRIGSASP